LGVGRLLGALRTSAGANLLAYALRSPILLQLFEDPFLLGVGRRHLIDKAPNFACKLVSPPVFEQIAHRPPATRDLRPCVEQLCFARFGSNIPLKQVAVHGQTPIYRAQRKEIIQVPPQARDAGNIETKFSLQAGHSQYTRQSYGQA